MAETTSGPVDIFVALSTFAADTAAPLTLLESSGLRYRLNTLGRRLTSDEVVALGGACRAVIAGVEPYDAATLQRMPALMCISRCGSGIDNVDLDHARRQGVAVLNTPDPPVQAVAELTITMMLSILREIPAVDAAMHARRWQRISGRLLGGKTVGVVGLGRIGRAVAALLQPFGTTVIGADPHPPVEWAAEHQIRLVDLPALLDESDIVSLHASRTADRPVRIDAAHLARMKPGGWLVNVARGDMVDDVALDAALRSGHLSGAALDVFPREPYDGPLCDNPRALLSPHQATLTLETREAMETGAVRNAIEFLARQQTVETASAGRN